ncbi:FAD-dependent oxidoreductase [Methylocystis parvus]|uniref:FAD-dependent oxidoreductase n=2 Tax=Methylocystis parvus TaxID=134 RepID=A0A6B8MAM7_9HYPH|nr:FAD-dependent oxidoreductase [Methylocystis parvus]
MLTRRQAITTLGAALTLPCAAETDDRIGPWTGDNFVPMHAIRDGLASLPLPAPERRVEVAIVGAGLAGLAVATLLRDRDLLLIEREAEPGGVAKSAKWRDVEYALGSAYFIDLREPFGPFYDLLGLTPKPAPEPENYVIAANAGGADALQGDLRRPHDELRAIIKRISESPDFPDLPVETASAGALALDDASLLDFLRREHVDPAMFAFLDAFSLSALGAPAAAVSAYAGVNFLSEMAGRIYAFPGGNAAPARAMANLIVAAGAGRIVTGASVYAIEPGDGGEARVAWFSGSDPTAAHCVAAKWVVIAAPYFFAAQILRGLDPVAKARMLGLRQGSFLVANCCFEGAYSIGAYDSWALEAAHFTDAVDAGHVLAARPKDHGVLTVYAPFRDPDLGRRRLREGNGAAFAAPLVEELRRFLPGAFAQARLAEVRLTRWGHHHMIAAPGIVRTMRALPKRIGNVLLAHSDGQGMPAVESALTEAHRAAAIIRRG